MSESRPEPRWSLLTACLLTSAVGWMGSCRSPDPVESRPTAPPTAPARPSTPPPPRPAPTADPPRPPARAEVELSPGTPEQNRSLQLAKGLALSGSCSAAAPHLEAVIAGPLTAARISALLLLGDCQRTVGQLHETVATYERARSLVPAIAEVHAALGQAYLEVGRVEDAIVSLRHALRLSPQLVTTYLALGDALRSLGRGEEAAQVAQDYNRQVGLLIGQTRPPAHATTRLAAVKNLCLIEGEPVMAALAAALTDEEPQIRAVAASGLAEYPSPQVLELLRERLRDELAPEVITALKQAVGALERELLPPRPDPTPRLSAPTEFRVEP